MRLRGSWALAALLGMTGSALVADSVAAAGHKLAFIEGDVLINRYPESSGNDLLTGGLGAAGLAGPAPQFSNPADPEALRTAAIYGNYRALVDTTTGGGYGRLYGPLVAPTMADASGKIYGVEYLAFASDRSGDRSVTLMVQIPEAFDPAKACIVTGPSSGSRGIYGAIGTSGEWGLKHGCAVAYTDKGTGTGAHNLERDTVGLLRGERADADAAGQSSTFTADLSDQEQARLNERFPDRWAWKHAHSRRNPEAHWDDHVLLSLQFALWALNAEFVDERAGGGAPRFNWANTLVIASSVSNGGAASLRAAEIAPKGMIDGVVVSEPNVNPVPDRRFAIRQGREEPLRRHSLPLYDYLTLIDLYQGCAILASGNASAPFNLTPVELGQNRCNALAARGLLKGSTVSERALEAQAIINGYGILPEQNDVAPAYWNFYVAQAVAVTYANAYARAPVEDNLCGFSFAATDGTATSTTFNQIIPLPPASEAILFATANGIPPTGGINVVNNDSPGGAVRDQVSRSRSSGLADQNLDGHLCLRSLLGGRPYVGSSGSPGNSLDHSIRQILADGKLNGIPAILLHGRDDALIAPNHSSRPYVALSRLRDGRRSNISYVEVTNAQHLDAFNAFPGFDERFIPLHYYFVQALDQMYAHLTKGRDLPPSQVVHTVPRGRTGDTVPAIEHANLPPIQMRPEAAARITFDGRTLFIPD
ncbi:MAG TPA: 3-hydroxybutyrate oligomer hydrolase family protein [Geminicoccus sp.]|jgi:hydroxybutyrate-dimer hydrolase|uniref:3-hydroxybutyrate oligomer hydrolase family protein n=1 Tax=Geminicoccus sp. TaxID=2024832 RepID=UPI002E354D9C|nr:3-hydroxybutyrate oligomer hydrolase family protein [Geminicoccus sp.]HEX2524890.1 3-hydroxybutyrate oligomer hydrolase family protein [Geminicoccus sp.]